MEQLILEIKNSLVEINILVFFFKLLLATILSSTIAFHVSHVKKTLLSSRYLEIAKAQILICISGTILIIMIGDSVARAFGLFGLGSFIKFRTSINDAMDTAVIFALIAIGIAVGLGLYIHAIIAWGFLYILLFFLYLIKAPEGSSKSRHVK